MTSISLSLHTLGSPHGSQPVAASTFEYVGGGPKRAGQPAPVACLSAAASFGAAAAPATAAGRPSALPSFGLGGTGAMRRRSKYGDGDPKT